MTETTVSSTATLTVVRTFHTVTFDSNGGNTCSHLHQATIGCYSDPEVILGNTCTEPKITLHLTRIIPASIKILRKSQQMNGHIGPRGRRITILNCSNVRGTANATETARGLY